MSNFDPQQNPGVIPPGSGNAFSGTALVVVAVSGVAIATMVLGSLIGVVFG